MRRLPIGKRLMQGTDHTSLFSIYATFLIAEYATFVVADYRAYLFAGYN
jgi:hypothetical protein